MLLHMRTTLIVNDNLMARIKSLAALEKATLSAMVEKILIRGLSERIAPKKNLRALPSFRAGKERVDISNREALYQFIDKK